MSPSEGDAVTAHHMRMVAEGDQLHMRLETELTRVRMRLKRNTTVRSRHRCVSLCRRTAVDA